MKTIKLFSVITFFYILFGSCKLKEVPAELVGKWESKQKVTVRTKESGQYIFLNAPDSVLLQFTIDDKGNVSGHLGDAVLENCKVGRNRGNLGRALNLATDYVIKGNLKGAIFPSDPYLNKEISAPFDIKNNKMEGSFFQMFGLDLYPITGMDAVKQ
jgi:hypothetical protein